MARRVGVGEGRGGSSIELMWTSVKKSLVTLEKRFRLYSVGNTGLTGFAPAAFVQWIGHRAATREKMLVSRTRIEM